MDLQIIKDSCVNDISRYLNHKVLIETLDGMDVPYEKIGESEEGRSINCVTIGSGKVRLFIWSQMHGNESTGTRAMLAILNLMKHKQQFAWVLDYFTINFVPMLNPDGAEVYSRLTPLGIDTNRDFIKEDTKEIRVLKKIVDEFDPDWMFNLHDQRTIFGIGEEKAANLSFLAPSFNVERAVNSVRRDTMAVIACISNNLQLLNINVGRYNDAFYQRSTGDNFTRSGRRCILFESGHFSKDYDRDQTTIYTTAAILEAFKAIESFSTWNAEEYGEYVRKYQLIPENKEVFYDIILRNVKLSPISSIITDCALQFKESFVENAVSFVPTVVEIGDMGNKRGHQEADLNGVYVAELKINQTLADETLIPLGLEIP